MTQPTGTPPRPPPVSNRKPIFAEAAAVKAFAQPGSVWGRLGTGTRQQDPFCCTPEWQMSFHEAFSPQRRLFMRQAGDGFISFAENILSFDDVILTPVEAHWFFGSNVMGADGMELFHDSLGDIERYYFPFFPRIMVSALPPRGVALTELQRRFSGRFRLTRYFDGVQCAASLAGGIDGYLSRRSANHRKKMNKQARNAAQAGVAFERHSPSTPEAAAAIYARMLAVEQTSWKGAIESGLLQDRSKNFYDIMLKRLSATQGARVIFARHDGRDIGFIFGGVAGGVYRGQQFSYSQDWRDASIGNVLQMQQVGWLCEEGASRYDMGPLVGPRMEYKHHWTEKQLHIESWVIER